MRKISKIFYLATGALLFGALLLPGCIKEEASPLAERHEASVQFNVGTRVADESVPTEEEGKIYTLRVYAFVGGQPAGHYFTDAVTAGQHTFYMDLAFYTDGVQTVDFYAVANEAAMSLKRSLTPDSDGPNVTLTEATSETELNNVWFNDLLRTHLATKGLPMFCKKSVDLDFRKVKTETPPAGSGHEGHVQLQYDAEPIVFDLQRPVGKIGVFAAKAPGETGALHVTGLTMLADGIKVRNYLMPQTLETLQMVLSGGRDLSIQVAGGEVTKELSADADRTDPANYASVTGEHFYLYENPWSNGGSWDIPGDKYGNVLKIDYDFDGADTRTGYVYMPAIERNHYYAVCCLMHADGRIYVEYSVADWDTPQDGDYNLDFQYPAYGNPIMPETEYEVPSGQFPQPTVYYNSDESDTAGSYIFRFNVRGPENLPWVPVMFDATKDDFEIEVYQINVAANTRDVIYRFGGKKTEITGPCLADLQDDPFYIKVRALKSKNVGKTLSLGIAYRESWLPEDDQNLQHSPLLLINGLTSDLAYAGSSYAEFVVIQQVDLPGAQTTDKR